MEKNPVTAFTDFSPKYVCDTCHIKCSRESEWKRHIVTRKHLAKVDGKNGNTLELKNFTTPKLEHICAKCTKIYQTSSGLWKHSRTCNEEKEIVSEPVASHDAANNEIILALIKENSDFKTLLMEMMKSVVQSNASIQNQILEVCKSNQQQSLTNIINNNNNNKTTTFNMQFFLNETCKDAMNLKDFVDSIQLTLADFQMVGEKGIIDGLSNILIKSLRATELNMRPIHCSDAKREVMYVKDNDKWEKDGPKNDKLRHVVKNVEHKNIRLLVDYCKEHPDFMDPESPGNDEYLRMSSVATSGTDDHLDKIITKLAKEVVVDK